MNRHVLLFAVMIFSISVVAYIPSGFADNSQLFISAENSEFSNYFSGSMVVEVVVRDPNLNRLDESIGEPDVTINGKNLRMVQTTDGSWYAYFANLAKAKIADNIASDSGVEGVGLDFGVFCSADTSSSVFGVSFSDTAGIAVPKKGSLSGFTNGNTPFSACTGTLSDTTNINNVVRNSKTINTNSAVSSGQIGLNQNAWPLIQLFSFDDVTIQYNAAGQTHRVDLKYDEIPNISFNIDRDIYPQNSQVFLAINDFQLNQDPTDEDSWTFNIDSTVSTFYQAYDNSGSTSATGGAGLVNLVPHLSSLGFDKNGKLTIDIGDVIELQSNANQPATSVTDGTDTFSQIITMVERGPNSGIFESFDHNDESTMKISSNAPRGQTGTIEYNQESLSVLTGFSTGSLNFNDQVSLSVDSSQLLEPGRELTLRLVDPDQNLNSADKDVLNVFRDTALIPVLEIGNPITLESASQVKFFSTSTTALTGGDEATSTIPDKKSDILQIDTDTVSDGTYEKISFKLGKTGSDLQSVLIDASSDNNQGTNWINYDFRSFENDLGITDFSDTTITLYFEDLTDTSPITIADAGDLSSAKGFVQIDTEDITSIFSETKNVFVVVNFDLSANDSGVLTVASESSKQPIVLDLFSYGLKNNLDVNNSIYRFELEETGDDTSIFVGTIEYSTANQLNIENSAFIQTAQTIDDEIKFIVTTRLLDEESPTISYSDLAQTGISVTESKQSDLFTHSGTVSTDSASYRIGQPVTIVLKDPDLNLSSDTIDIYRVNNDSSSPNVDTIGVGNNILLEILIKDIRYKRCTIDGTEHGGLASTGFSLIETGPDSGIFTGVFKMPSKICNKSGTALITPVGGSIDAKYHDFRDASGNENIFSLSRQTNSVSYSSVPQLSIEKVPIPKSDEIKEIILTGAIHNHKRGIPLSITLTYPNDESQSFGSTLTDTGKYKSIFSIKSNSMTGIYRVDLSYDQEFVGTVYFTVFNPQVPDWVKNNARWWSDNTISESEFIEGLEHLIEQDIISLDSVQKLESQKSIPDWIKNNAKWWSENQISDQEFINSIEYLVKIGIIRI